MTINRLLDIAGAACGLLLASPLLIPVSVAMLFLDPGPLFYLQERVGRDKRPFRMIKFRTMVVGADTVGPHVTAKHDPRVTPMGGFLRRTKLDELPELWNVLRGEMSLVGPRPEVPRYVARYPLEWDKVFSVRPGITDLATLQFRDEESVLADAAGPEPIGVDREQVYLDLIVPIKIRLALWYIRNRSLALDLRILVDTLLAITIGRLIPMRFGPDWAKRTRMEVRSRNSKVKS